jgi:hypothetical protein
MKNRTRAGFYTLLLSAWLTLVSCGSPEGRWKGSVTRDDSGIMIIKNPREPLFGERVVRLEEELCITGGQEDQTFMNIVSLAVDSDERIYALDARAGNIKVFSSSGEFLKVIGRRGQGPGEFGGPERLAISPQNEIVVSDPSRRLIHFLDLEGHYIRQLPLNLPFFSGPKILSNGDIIASYAILGDEYSSVLCRFDSQMNPVYTYTSIPMYKLPRVHIFLYRFVNDLQWDITPNDEVAWAAMTSSEYEINVHDQRGPLIKKIIKEYDPIDITDDEYNKLMKAWFGRPPSGGRFELIIPNHYPPFHTFMVDGEGRIFVRRFEEADKGERIYCEIFDQEGRYLTDFIFPEKTIPILFRGNNLFTREEDSEGYQVIIRYQVKWKLE